MYYRIDEIPQIPGQKSVEAQVYEAQAANLARVEKSMASKAIVPNGFQDRFSSLTRDKIGLIPVYNPPPSGLIGGDYPIPWEDPERGTPWPDYGNMPPIIPDLPGTIGAIIRPSPPITYRVGYKKRRRINCTNQKALKRALRRLCCFQKMVNRTWAVTGSLRSKRRGTACGPKKRKCG
jgi:hypothetical protein